MRREPEPRRGARRKRRTQEEEAPLVTGEDESDEGNDDSGDEDEDNDPGFSPEEEPERQPALISRAVQPMPSVADVRPGMKAEGDETLEGFVARFADLVERDPENHAFELHRVFPKTDKRGNPCTGSVGEFWRTDLLTMDYLRRNYSPGHYTLAVRGIGESGKRGVYIGIHNGIKIAVRSIGGEEVPLDSIPRAGAGPNGGAGNGAGMTSDHKPFTPWAKPPVVGEPAVGAAPSAPVESEKVALAREQLLRDSIDRGDGWAHEAMAQAQRVAIAPPAPLAPTQDASVVNTALTLFSDAAKAGPREQSETEKRLLDQINALRSDLATLQTKHVEEVSKLRADHTQELFRERDASMKARDDLVTSYEKNLDTERRRNDESRASQAAQHQAYISQIEGQNRTYVEAVRSSLEARAQGLTDQLTAVRDELSRSRTESSNELSRLRQELSEERTRSMSGQHDLVLAKVEAKTAEVTGKMAGDSLSSAGKMLSSVRGFAEMLGYTAPGLAGAAAAPAEEQVGGTLAKMAGAAQSLFASEGFAKLAEAAASRLRNAGGGTPAASPATVAQGVAAWNAHRETQRQSAMPPAPQAPQIEARRAPAQAAPQPAPVQAQATVQEGIEDSALMGVSPAEFIGQVTQIYGVDAPTLRSAVEGAADADVWSFLNVNPAELSATGQEFAAAVLMWLRQPEPTA